MGLFINIEQFMDWIFQRLDVPKKVHLIEIVLNMKISLCKRQKNLFPNFVCSSVGAKRYFT